MAYKEKDTKKWTAQWFETNARGEKKKRIYRTHAPISRLITGCLIHMTDKNNGTFVFLRQSS